MNKPFIVLVDDESEFIETMSKRLQKRELKVLTANSGEEAMEVVHKNPKLEVMILDVKMPGMDGLSVLQEMRKKYPLIEVIMLTGHATIESAIEGMKLGAFDYLMKPCEMELLLEKVEAAAEKKQIHEDKIQKARIERMILSRGV
jgi:two-component system, OmpR family, response regulator VicR